ncbi:hypothetical protein HBB16_07035 [Pseudonocardia sp. MCCB 268]|nr:hypothetical protein [Pseudonocardia cytotoxica]
MELIDRAASCRPRPELAATLANYRGRSCPTTAWSVLQARDRQLAHEHAGFYMSWWRSATRPHLWPTCPRTRTTSRAGAVVRSEDQFQGGREIAAGLTWTRARANASSGSPPPCASGCRGCSPRSKEGSDRLAKAGCWSTTSTPAPGTSPPEQAGSCAESGSCRELGWTTARLRDRLYRALLAPERPLRRRRYQRAVRAPQPGALPGPAHRHRHLAGTGLPADEAAAAPPAWTGWRRLPAGGTPRHWPRSAPTCTWGCSTAPSTA